MSDRTRSQVLDAAAAAGAARSGGGPALRALLEHYYRHVAEEDLRERDPADLAGACLSHHDLAEHRAPGTARVRAWTPTAAVDGWSAGRGVVEVVTDDMPFLVDSVTAALAQLGRTVHVVVHPTLLVRRDAGGRLLQVLDGAAPGAPRPADALVESWMHVEVEHDDHDGEEGDAERVGARVLAVLADVRAAVEDWAPMRAAALAVAAELASRPPQGLGEEAREGERLLRWLADGGFTFLGSREYALEEVDGEDVLRVVPGTGLGILREGGRGRSASFARLPSRARARARERRVLVLTKANARATVHRPAHLDYVGVKSFDAQGRVVGERRFLGLFSSEAYTQSVLRVPLLDSRAAAVLARSGFAPGSHSAKDLLAVLETYPRDELFQMGEEEVLRTALAVMRLQERRRTRLFLRRDAYGRFQSAVVYLPRDRYTTQVRLRVQQVLVEAFGASSVDYTTQIGESVLARVHVVLRVPAGTGGPELAELSPDEAAALERRVVEATRTWEEDLADAMTAELGEAGSAALRRTWGRSFPEAYKEDFGAREAVADLRRVAAVAEAAAAGADADRLVDLHLHRPAGAGPQEWRMKLYRVRPLSLTRVLPLFRNLGAEVVDERPYRLVRRDGAGAAHVYDFGLRLPADVALAGADADVAGRAGALFTEAFRAAWDGRSESDGFDELVLRAGLSWDQVVVLRAVARYLRQTTATFSHEYLVECLVANAGIARQLVRLFEARCEPREDGVDGVDGADGEVRAASAEVVDALVEELQGALDDVVSLDHDRILRSFLSVVTAVLRTNAYQLDAAGRRPQHLVLKLDPARLRELPEPRPAFELWVYSPRVEGVHLRFGAVARGGLRWSDRREDFRTEVLGLVKAQAVKNAVIVPTGAKGGFVPKQLPDPADRDAWLAEGLAAYRTFVGGLLDVTDDLVPDPGAPGRRRVQPPPRVVRHDGDDPYLVVAADKGTATFSDTANAIAAEHGFWLDDAFASGGSAGYDHKAMGITARGAWTSVRHHFREVGVDPHTTPITVAGIGDMSGDVFGNGMLLSDRLRLVAAFDHRHVFLDPAPDPATSWAERARLFALPRSSWADYDRSLISPGGGVFARTAKSVPLSRQAVAALGLPAGTTSLTPAEVVRAVLAAPVDLLWNGGIGTYVKGAGETSADAGDRANDAVRIDGGQLRARVVGEGGNLGLTQRGRIEAALAGVRLNTDAVDNSAGVDCSDHEVNIKVLLADAEAAGELTRPERDALLVAMTDEVAALVLRDNDAQNVLLTTARAQAPSMLGVHLRLVAALEADGALDRALEVLPTEAEGAERAARGLGLTSPELATLMAHVKNALAAHLLTTDLPDDPAFEPLLRAYFPAPLVQRFGERVAHHQLRREIITTALVNDLVNTAGTSFVHRATEETGASPEHVVRAYAVCREVFGAAGHLADVAALDGLVPTGVQTRLRLELRRLLDRSTRWLVQTLRDDFAVEAEVARFAPVVQRWSDRVGDLLAGAERERWARATDELVDAGVPRQLAGRSAGLLHLFGLLDVVQTAAALGLDPDDVAPVRSAVSERYAADELLLRISGLQRGDRWAALARAALRDDLYALVEALTRAVIAAAGTGAWARTAGPAELVAAWEAANAGQLERVRATLDQVQQQESSDLASLSVALRLLRGLVRSGSA